MALCCLFFVYCSRHLISTTAKDFFSPISLDPYKQGRIACANTLSDLYAIGAHRVDTMLMILSVSTKMEDEHRDIAAWRRTTGGDMFSHQDVVLKM